MTVSFLDSAVESSTLPASFAISAGADRVFVIIEYRYSGSDATPYSGITWGDQALTLEGTADFTDSNAATQIWVLREAEIAAKTGDALVVSGGDSGNIEQFTYFSLQDAEQGAWTQGIGTVTATSGSVSLVRAEDSLTIAAYTHQAGNDGTMSNPGITSQINISGAVCVWGSQVEASAVTEDVTWTNAFNRDNTLVALNIPTAVTGPDNGVTESYVTPDSGENNSSPNNPASGLPPQATISAPSATPWLLEMKADP